MAAPSLPAALAASKPLTDKPGLSLGAMVLQGWADQHLQWSDVEGQEVTIHDAVADPDGTRGKKLCITGKLQQMSASPDGGAAVSAVIKGKDFYTYRLLLARSRGKVKNGVTTSFCGVSMGISELPGETPEMVALGMFDLPENH